MRGKHIRAIRNYTKILTKHLKNNVTNTCNRFVNLGFQATTHMCKNCLNEAERKKGGRDPVNDEIVKEIEFHLESLSSIAANRFLKMLNTNAFF